MMQYVERDGKGLVANDCILLLGFYYLRLVFISTAAFCSGYLKVSMGDHSFVDVPHFLSIGRR
jgi:hypothetical protein